MHFGLHARVPIYSFVPYSAPYSSVPAPECGHTHSRSLTTTPEVAVLIHILMVAAVEPGGWKLP